MSREEAFAVINEPRYRNQVILALGALNQWRTCTGEQLAAITAVNAFANRFVNRATRSPVLLALWTLGLVDFGRSATGFWAKQQKSAPLLWRPGPDRLLQKLVLKNLSQAESFAITGGAKLDNKHQFDRHNVLTTELALRFAELEEAGTVVGEKFSTFDALSAGRWSKSFLVEQRTVRNNMADATLVRADGLRIAIEITASAGGPVMQRKVDSWAKLLQNSPFEETGLVVLFIIAPPLQQVPAANVRFTGYMSRAFVGATRRYPGFPGDLTGDRMFFASWEDYFPDAHQASDKFGLLQATKVSGGIERTWTSVDLMDVFDLPLPQARRLAGVIGNSLALAGTPALIGRRHPDFQGLDFTTGALERLGGIGRGLSVVSIDPNFSGAPRNPGAKVGVADIAQLPERLVWAPHSKAPLPTVA